MQKSNSHCAHWLLISPNIYGLPSLFCSEAAVTLFRWMLHAGGDWFHPHYIKSFESKQELFSCYYLNRLAVQRVACLHITQDCLLGFSKCMQSNKSTNLCLSLFLFVSLPSLIFLILLLKPISQVLTFSTGIFEVIFIFFIVYLQTDRLDNILLGAK